MKTAVPEVSEQQQIEAAQRDPKQFAVLYDRHFHRVFGYVARRLPTRDEAEDVTSEVFHQALASIQSFRWQGTPFIAWLLGIAARLIAKRWQQIGRSPTIEGNAADAEGDGRDAEQQAILTEFVDRLPEDQRRVIVLRFIDQRSIREIAATLGRSEGAIKQLQFRALEHLRNLVRPL